MSVHVERFSISDEILVKKIVDGDRSAFAKLVQRHTTKFYAVAYRLVQNKEEAEDIVQDGFLKLWTNPQLWDGTRGAKFTTWFYRLIHNLCIDALRKRKPMLIIEDDAVKSTDDTVEDFAVQGEQAAVLLNYVQKLPEKQQVALNLCFYEDKSNKEAAEIMGVSLRALQSLLMRAKVNLKEQVKLHFGKKHA